MGTPWVTLKITPGSWVLGYPYHTNTQGQEHVLNYGLHAVQTTGEYIKGVETTDKEEADGAGQNK